MHFVLEKYLTTCIKKQRIAENGGCDESTTDKNNSISLPFSLSFLKEVYSGRMGSDGHSWEYREEGVKVTNRWIEDNGQWFYFKEDGTMAKSEWITQSGMFYYMMEDGAMAQSQWIEIKGK